MSGLNREHAILVAAALLAMWIVPSMGMDVLSHPTVLGVSGTLAATTFLVAIGRIDDEAWTARWEPRILAGFLASMPLVYLAGWFVVGGELHWLVIELVGQALFAAWALVGGRGRWRALAVGIAAHGLLWDSWHLVVDTPYMPDWYAWACLTIDVGFGAFVWLRSARW